MFAGNTVKKIKLRCAPCIVQGQAALDMWESRLSYYVYETVGCLRIASFFDMVVDYPDSQPALEDLRECLKHTNLHSHFISRFRSAIQQRLLHAGQHRILLVRNHKTSRCCCCSYQSPVARAFIEVILMSRRALPLLFCITWISVGSPAAFLN